jgi:integrase
MTTPSSSSKTDELTTQNDLSEAGLIANDIAARGAFSDYQARKAANTLRRQAADLALFAEYLASVNLRPGNFETDPEAWRGITWGLVEGFIRWQLQAGYAVGSVNVRLATVKGYARLALKAGSLSATEFAMMMTVKGYSHKEALHVDERRQNDEVATRKGAKKAIAVSLTPDQAARLMTHPETPQGRRDALLMTILLEHGLRVGEVARLLVTDFDLKAGELKFYRPKVDKTQIHKLSVRTLAAAKAYFEQDAPAAGNLWRGSASKRDGRAAAGHLTTQGLSDRAITSRVETLGMLVGAEGLSAHDCRHYWATQAARSGTPIDRLQDAGGWNSPVMPLRYIETAKIANEGVRLE